jgi:hypothetical protein
VSAAGRLAAVGIAAYAYGALTAAIPAPADPAVFWPGNLAAPYVALPFLAATWRFDRLQAALAGAITGMAMVAGFYGFLSVGGAVTPNELELPLTTTIRDAMLIAYGRWLGTFVLGVPGGIPWLTIGAIVGTMGGLLGHAWAAEGRTWAGVAVASLFVIEPVIRVLGAAGVLPTGANDLVPANLAIWGIEALLGLAAIALVVRVGRAALPPQGVGASSRR